MRKVYKDEWKILMSRAIENKLIGEIEFLWSKFREIEEYGYFELPF